MYEEGKLLKLLRENQTIPVKDLSRRIVDSVLTFQGTHPQEDDITLVLLKA